ncbi:phage tail protein [Escherichia coli]|uniref:phage tail protein n=1 Tax=Escherichia coli TaxID=562 RepID=UPI003890BFBC
MPVSCYLCIFLNVGLGEGSALPVGVPVPWPSATPPTGWIKCNGAPFSAQEYPELAKAYPTNKLPDLRGEFIRGWDDGRGVDTGRGILSAQGDAIRNITGWFGAHATVVAKPPFVKFSAPEIAENVGVGGGVRKTLSNLIYRYRSPRQAKTAHAVSHLTIS